MVGPPVDSRTTPLIDPHTPGMARSTPLLSLRRVVSWHRRKLAVLAAVVAVIAGVNAATPQPAPTVEVVVLAHDLAGGTRIRAGDLTVARWPVGVAPDRAVTDQADVVGRTLVAPSTRGSALTELSVLTPRSTAARPGSVIVAIKLADPTLVQLLSVGDRVDVLVATVDPGGGQASSTAAVVVASAALLVTVPAASGEDGPIGSGTSGSTESTVILVSVDAPTAVRLTQAAVTGPLTVVLR